MPDTHNAAPALPAAALAFNEADAALDDAEVWLVRAAAAELYALNELLYALVNTAASSVRNVGSHVTKASTRGENVERSFRTG